jgi:hypothetical protein
MTEPLRIPGERWPRLSAVYGCRCIHSATPQRSALTCRDGCAFLSGEGMAPTDTEDDVAAFAYDIARTGKDTNETILGTSNVGAMKQLATTGFTSSGATDAPPIGASSVRTASGATQNLIYGGNERGALWGDRCRLRRCGVETERRLPGTPAAATSRTAMTA